MNVEIRCPHCGMYFDAEQATNPPPRGVRLVLAQGQRYAFGCPHCGKSAAYMVVISALTADKDGGTVPGSGR